VVQFDFEKDKKYRWN